MFDFKSLLSVFYPVNCKACQQPLIKGESFFCLHCELNFSEIKISSDKKDEIEQLFWGKSKIEIAFATYEFLKKEHLQQLIHEFKYSGNKRLAQELGMQMWLQSGAVFKDIDTITYVPMHKKKQRKRGYNHAEELARGVGAKSGLPVMELIFRLENTRSQTEKGVFERFKNMESKFTAMIPSDVNHYRFYFIRLR